MRGSQDEAVSSFRRRKHWGAWACVQSAGDGFLGWRRGQYREHILEVSVEELESGRASVGVLGKLG